MNTFLKAYVECALWSSNDDNGNPLDDWATINDLAPETLAIMTADCADFQESFADLLEDIDNEQAGHDFWLTRNGHGAGFWDRGLGDIGDQLTEMAKPYGEVNLYVVDCGDVDLIYC